MKSLLTFVGFVAIVYILGAFAFTNTLDKAFNYSAPPEPPRCLYTISLHYDDGDVKLDSMNLVCGSEFHPREEDGHPYIWVLPDRVWIHSVTHCRIISVDTLKK